MCDEEKNYDKVPPSPKKQREETEHERRELSAAGVGHMRIGGATHTAFLSLDPNWKHDFGSPDTKIMEILLMEVGERNIYEEISLFQNLL